jgi:hypothetical protein
LIVWIHRTLSSFIEYLQPCSSQTLLEKSYAKKKNHKIKANEARKMYFDWKDRWFVFGWVDVKEDAEVPAADLEAFRVSLVEGRVQLEKEVDLETDRQEQIQEALYFQTLEVDFVCGLSLPGVIEHAKAMVNNTRTYLSRSGRANDSSLRILAKQECSICLENYKGGETICLPNIEDCIHVFHENCISAWLTDHDDCPLCRTDLMKGNMEKPGENEELPV